MLGFRHIAAAANGEFVLNITANLVNPNIYALAIDAGWNGNSPLLVNITSTRINTLSIPGTWNAPSGLAIRIGSSTLIGGTQGVGPFGGDGGTAIIVAQKCSIENNGIIAGGAGAGGGGAGAFAQYGSNTSSRVSASGGDGGNGYGFILGTTNIGLPTYGAQGEYKVCDVAVVGGQERPWARGGAGGDGGNSWGSAGNNGSNYQLGGDNNTGYEWYSAYAGGKAGYALQGNSFVTWVANGTRIGGVV